ncbi:MAG: alpha/beta hydrolase [Pseudomonadota bacterium]
MTKRTVETDTLRIAVETVGDAGAPPVVLQHGWPDSVESFASVAERLAARGYHCVLPTLRGHGETEYMSDTVPRSGEVVALARDLEAVIDGLGLTRPHVVGHDWGARAAYPAAILFPDKLASIVPISVGWHPAHAAPLMPIEQAQAFWYQWWFATPMGAAALRDRPEAVARRMWEVWSPDGWFADRDWEAARPTFANPDWAATVTHFYRARYGLADGDPAYAADAVRFQTAATIAVPTLLVHGRADRCTLPSMTDGMAEHVTEPYERVLLEEVGHFPQREAPDSVADLLLDWFARRGASPS